MLCLLYGFHFYFFFFKQKTAYEMRISDWSSDVCSSDLTGRTSAYVMGVPAQGAVGAFIASTQSTAPIGRAALRASFGISAPEHPSTLEGDDEDAGVAGQYVSPLDRTSVV